MGGIALGYSCIQGEVREEPKEMIEDIERNHFSDVAFTVKTFFHFLILHVNLKGNKKV